MNTLINATPMPSRRLLTEQEAAGYVSMGRTSFRAWAKEIGACKHFGRSVRYDRDIIDHALNEMAAEAENGADQ